MKLGQFRMHRVKALERGTLFKFYQRPSIPAALRLADTQDAETARYLIRGGKFSMRCIESDPDDPCIPIVSADDLRFRPGPQGDAAYAPGVVVAHVEGAFLACYEGERDAMTKLDLATLARAPRDTQALDYAQYLDWSLGYEDREGDFVPVFEASSMRQRA